MNVQTFTRMVSFLPDRFRYFCYRQILEQIYEPRIDPESDVLERSIVTFCFDFELAWAWRFVPGAAEVARKKAELERRQIPRILKDLEVREIPTTWATVGMMVDESHGKDPDFGPAPPLSAYRNKSWVYSGRENPIWGQLSDSQMRQPEWFGVDLLEKILKARPSHEIASHSFLHHDCSQKVYTEEFFRWELSAQEKVLKRFGIVPKTFIYPGGFVGQSSLLPEYGYLLTRYFPRSSRAELATPMLLKDPLWGIHETLCLEAYGYDAAYLGAKARVLLAKALPQKKVISFWLHPSLNEKDYEYIFRPVLDWCVQKRDQGELDILTNLQVRNCFVP